MENGSAVGPTPSLHETRSGSPQYAMAVVKREVPMDGAKSYYLGMRFIVGLAIVAVIALPGAGAATLRETCDASEVRAAFNSFVARFNGGRYSELQSIFAAEPDFMWHAVAPPYGRVAARAYNHATAVACSWQANHRPWSMSEGRH